MQIYEEKLKRFISENQIPAEHFTFETTCYTVEEAAAAVNALPSDLVKNICMVDEANRFIVAVVKGEDRVSTKRVAKALQADTVRMANPDEVLEKTGYICGGVPSFGFDAIFLIDPNVMEKEIVYTGGGSEFSLTKISTRILQQMNRGQIVRMRK